MVKCQKCNKNSNKNRVVTNGVCNECNIKVPVGNIDFENAPFKAGDTLASTNCMEFVEWMKVVFIKCVTEAFTSELNNCKKELAENKKNLTAMKTELKSTQNELKNLKTKLSSLSEEFDKNKTCAENNLRYLINHDRNSRQRNVVVFGLPDDDEISLGDEVFENDLDAVNHVLDQLELPEEVKIIELFRLGKKQVEDGAGADENQRRHRPIKIRFETSGAAKMIVGNSAKLKGLFGEETKIYLNTDKTKSEREEFSRLGKKKKDLMLRHPAENEGDPPRVILKNGRLLVDNAEVDCYKAPQTLF